MATKGTDGGRTIRTRMCIASLLLVGLPSCSSATPDQVADITLDSELVPAMTDCWGLTEAVDTLNLEGETVIRPLRADTTLVPIGCESFTDRSDGYLRITVGPKESNLQGRWTSRFSEPTAREPGTEFEEVAAGLGRVERGGLTVLVEATTEQIDLKRAADAVLAAYGVG